MNWTDEHALAARAEGWELGIVINSGRPAKEWYYQIFPAGGPFLNSAQATQFVIAKAKQRSALHILALQTCAASQVKNAR